MLCVYVNLDSGHPPMYRALDGLQLSYLRRIHVYIPTDGRLHEVWS